METFECECGWSGNLPVIVSGSLRCPECGEMFTIPEDTSQFGGKLGENID